MSGLASGDEFDSILEKLRGSPVRHDTFPAEDLLKLASESIDDPQPRPLIGSTAKTFGDGSCLSSPSPEGRSTTRASTPSLLPP
jgi:hypothetical protein